MASSFRISWHRKGGSVHIGLKGDFDGSSACQLCNLLNEKLPSVNEVVVHTDKLRNVYPFGRQVFERNLSYLQHSCPITFEGKHAQQLVSDIGLSL